jgi:hypothetical protein
MFHCILRAVIHTHTTEYAVISTHHLRDRITIILLEDSHRAVAYTGAALGAQFWINLDFRHENFPPMKINDSSKLK